MCTIDAMIPVWNPDKRLKGCVDMLLRQTQKIRKITLVFSVDSIWDDKKVEEWFRSKERVQIVRIPKDSFDHGGTRRRWAVSSNADYLLFLVQDAVPQDEYLVERLKGSIENEAFALAYARQIPGFGCDAIESYTRNFNYPPNGEIKTKEGMEKGGIKACFTSNVCAMYRKDWYERVGGFEDHILLSEDSVYAAKALREGARVVYCPDARIMHAHRFGYKTQWKRNFDIGVVHKKYAHIFDGCSSEKEGIRLVTDTALYLIREREWMLLPRLIGLSAVKFLGYQAGKHYEKLPIGLVIKWSLNENYWRKPYGKE